MIHCYVDGINPVILLGTKQYNKGERAIVNCTQHLLEIERYVVQYGILITCFFFFVKSRFSKRNGSVQVFANFKYGTILGITLPRRQLCLS